ncbi:MAG: hypothetical protein ACP5N3_01650 [Candidatus Nanoarchaeia archaeon]
MQESIELKKEGFPSNPIHRTNWFVYSLIVLLSMVFVIVPVLFLTLASMFMGGGQFMIYFWAAVIAAAIGAVTAALMLAAAKTKKRYVHGIFAPAIGSAVALFILIAIVKSALNNLLQSAKEYPGEGVLMMFTELQISPVIISLIVLVFFLIVPVIIYYKKVRTWN